jgi:hypothetical protein
MRPPKCVLLLFSLCALLAPPGRGQERIVDFRYAPAESWTVICLPDDWLKTAVGNSGALLYDFGPGPYGRGLTSIAVGMREDSLLVTGQSFDDPRVPILSTRLTGRGTVIEEQAFSLVPEKMTFPPAVWRGGRIRRTAGLNGCIGWACPADSVDEAFRNAAWGAGRPIRYAVRVKAGSSKRVALGVIEPYKWGPGARLIELRVEGAPPQIIDPMGDNVRNRPHVLFFDARDENKDGWLTIESHAPVNAPDPNISLSGFWIFPDHASVDTSSVISGKASRIAEIHHRCGTEIEENSHVARLDILSSRITGRGQPFVSVRTRRPLTYDSTSGILRYRGKPFLLCSPPPVKARRTPAGWELDVPEATHNIRVLVAHGGTRKGPLPVIPDAGKALKRTNAYWLQSAPIPRGRITVPDSMMQYLIDVNTRVMYQVRDVVDGIRQFQPGPTVYRGLWTGDVCLTGGTILDLGDTAGMRVFLEAALRFQLPSGQIRSLYPTISISETPSLVYGACWYAQATDNRAWLIRHWAALRSAVRWMESMRRSTFNPPGAPYAGLLPPGFVDGGISVPMADYSCVWWAIISLDRAEEAARWIGEEKDAAEFGAIRSAFLPAWERAARRDIRHDRKGVPFLPVGVGDTSTGAPQRGQYALLWPARFSPRLRRPGSLADSVIRMNLTMMDHYAQEGMVAGSGWLEGGLWTWLGQLQGTVWTLMGRPERGYEFLYASANHASSAGTWVEEQLPRGLPPRTTGDFADAEASAVFLHLVRILLATEDGDTLHLLRSLPGEWLRPGARVRLDNVVTDLGRVRFMLETSRNGRSAVLTYTPVTEGRMPPHIRLDLFSLSHAGFSMPDGSLLPGQIDIPPDRPWTIALQKPAR